MVMEFTKYDDGKYRRSYFDSEMISWIYKVALYGSKKYGVKNWKECQEQFRYFDAAERHMAAYQAGEIDDQESGMPHLAHAAFNILAELFIYNKITEK